MTLVAPAIEFKQNGQRMYLTALPARRLVDHTTVDHWSPDKPTGYQRVEQTAHIAQIARFLHQPNAILPLPGILNVRSSNRVHFRGSGSGSIKSGTLSIDDETDIFVVDMQHRRAGLRLAYEKLKRLENFPVPVVITDGLSPVDETLQFYLVNQKSKRIQSDLALRILLERLDDRNLVESVGEVGWQRVALAVTIQLNKDLMNPWKGRIRQPNMPKTNHHIASEKSFVPGLRPIVSFPAFSRLGRKRLSEITAGYWNGIESIFPIAFRNPGDHVIMSVTSYVAFHRLLPLVVATPMDGRHVWTTERAKRKTVSELGRLTALPSDFWDRTNRTGAAQYGSGFGAGGRLFTYLAEQAGLLDE